MNNTYFTKYLKSLLLTLLFVAGGAITTSTFAQSFSMGADFMSRYVWRGTDFGNSFSVQPTLEFDAGGFSLGTWGSYAISPVSSGVSENDLYIGYTFDTGSKSSFSVGATDYYFPNGGKFFKYNVDGENQLEPYISYTGPSSFPITLYGSIFATNEPDNSIYLEASYPVYSKDGTDVGLSVGGTPQKSGFYGTNKAGVLNLALSGSKAVKITDSFSLPISASYIINPYIEKTYLVFGISL